MVEISQRVELKYSDEKPITVHQDLIIEANGQKNLKIRPTSRPIIQFIPKNASLSASRGLQELLAKRSAKFHEEPEPDEECQGQLFDDEPSPQRPKKRQAQAMYEVTIKIGNTTIACLKKGKKPKAMDLTIQLEAEQWPHH